MTNLDPIRWAKFYASIKHAGQTYGGLPYTHHLAAVDAVGMRFGVGRVDVAKGVHCNIETSEDGTYISFPDAQETVDERTARWLHDVMEDCGVKRKEIAELFGDRVAELVWAVTNEPGENRKIRGALTYPKIRSVKGAVALKLDDRIANVEHGGKLVEMYRKEYEDFRRALYTQGECDARWAHLDRILG